MRDELVESETPMSGNEVILTAISKIAINTVTRLAADNDSILFTPKSVSELENNTTMLSNIVDIKIKNSLIKN